MAKKQLKKQATPQDYLMSGLGKIPPQAIDLEEGILGACLIESASLITAMKILRADSFYKDSHTRIFEGMMELHNAGNPIDILTVTNKLKELQTLELVGGPYFITQLSARVASGANIEFWCYKLEEFAIRRRLIRINSETIRDCYDESLDIFSITDHHQKAIDSGSVFVSGGTPDADQRTKEAFDFIHRAMETTEILGATSGIPKLDGITGGWMEGDLVVMAGRPGMGKTAVIMNTAYKSNKKVVLFELEMSNFQVATRELSMFSGVTMENIRMGNLSVDEYKAVLGAKNYINSKNVLIDTNPNLDITMLRAKLWDYIHSQNVGMAIIDYLQLMNIEDEDNKRDNYALAVGRVTRAIKLMAKQFKIPIILLSQLSRAVEGRQTKRPQLSDLRDSGAIEQDADSVIFLYREEYYNAENPVDKDGNSLKNTIEFIIAKNRQGRLGPVTTGYDPATNNFGNDFLSEKGTATHIYRPL